MRQGCEICLRESGDAQPFGVGGELFGPLPQVHADPQDVEAAVWELGVRCLPSDSEVLVLDFDATDD